jgi:hypothetical protein
MMKGVNVEKLGMFFGVGIIAVIFLTIGPLLVIWSLNTLFPALAIPYTFWTWLAALILGGAVKSKVEVKK